MGFVSWEISVIAFLPALFLCGFIYYKDKIEKEPIGLLLLLFGLGAAVYLPTMILEKAILGGVDTLFRWNISFSADGVRTYASEAVSFLHILIGSFFGVALVEVPVKWVILFFCTKKNRHFNYLFDGIVYSVFVSLGFAAAENLRFAWTNGWDMLVLRSIASVPGHLLVGIVMGYFYTLWNAYRKAKSFEESGIEKGVIKEAKIKKPNGYLILSILVPFTVAGAYMTAASVDSEFVNALFYFAVFCLYGFSFISVERMASKDRSASRFSMRLLKEKHPEAAEALMTALNGEKDGEAKNV